MSEILSCDPGHGGLGKQLSRLLPLLVSGDFEVAAAARTRMLDDLSRVPISKLSHLAETSRLNWYGDCLGSYSYFSLEPERFARFFRSQPSQDLLGFLSFHANGHLREAACRLLDPLKGGLPYLLIRLNDWVLLIQHLAHNLLNRDFDQIPHERWVENLFLVERLRDCGRALHDTFINRVYTRLQGPDAAKALERGCEHSDKIIRRTCFRLSLVNHEDPFKLFRQALGSGDITVRRWAMLGFEATLPPEQRLDFVRLALGNRSQQIRQLALRAWMRLQPDDQQPLIDALTDSNPAVRGLARYYVKGFELAEFYRKRLGTEPVALLGLAEADKKAGPELRPFLMHDDLRFQRAALQGLCFSGVDEQTLLNSLQSEDPSLSAIARRALERVRFIEASLRQILESSPYEHVRRNAYKLLR